MSATQDNWMLLKPFHTSTGDYHSLSTNWSISTLWKSFILIAEHENIQHSYPSLRNPNISCRQMNKFHCMDHLFTYISFANQYSHHSVSCFDLWIFTAVMWPDLNLRFSGFYYFYIEGVVWWEGRTFLAPSLLGRVRRPCKLWHFIPPPWLSSFSLLSPVILVSLHNHLSLLLQMIIIVSLPPFLRLSSN